MLKIELGNNICGVFFALYCHITQHSPGLLMTGVSYLSAKKKKMIKKNTNKNKNRSCYNYSDLE